MALIKCHECNAQVSTQAGKCPSCGAKVRKPVGKIGLIFAALICGLMIKCSIDSAGRERIAKTESPPDPRYDFAVLAGKSLKAHLNDPSSIEWVAIAVNDAATVVCMEYRAKNKFGAMVLEQAVAMPAGISTKAKDWNANCAKKQLNDYTSARHAM